jgi:GTPase KRas protein
LENDRQVPTHEGHNLAKSYECPFIEASARSRINVEESFFQLVRALHTTPHTTPHRTHYTHEPRLIGLIACGAGEANQAREEDGRGGLCQEQEEGQKRLLPVLKGHRRESERERERANVGIKRLSARA